MFLGVIRLSMVNLASTCCDNYKIDSECFGLFLAAGCVVVKVFLFHVSVIRGWTAESESVKFSIWLEIWCFITDPRLVGAPMMMPAAAMAPAHAPPPMRSRSRGRYMEPEPAYTGYEPNPRKSKKMIIWNWYECRSTWNNQTHSQWCSLIDLKCVYVYKDVDIRLIGLESISFDEHLLDRLSDSTLLHLGVDLVSKVSPDFISCHNKQRIMLSSPVWINFSFLLN